MALYASPTVSETFIQSVGETAIHIQNMACGMNFKCVEERNYFIKYAFINHLRTIFVERFANELQSDVFVGNGHLLDVFIPGVVFIKIRCNSFMNEAAPSMTHLKAITGLRGVLVTFLGQHGFVMTEI